jgi:protein-S-isoprenylcysteine O-methyltransferase Ste14
VDARAARHVVHLLIHHALIYAPVMRRAAVVTVVFFVAAPGVMAGLVPWWITGWDRPPVSFGVLDVLGLLLVAGGLAMVLDCFVRFVREGVGTPAPVAPTEFLVQGGLYRYVRNPMYVGVASMIGGQALVLRSTPLVWWWLAFLVAVVGFVKLYEEPTLREQFGASYDRYRSHVPGWLPRLRPWQG